MKRTKNYLLSESKQITRNIVDLTTLETFASQMRCSAANIHKTLTPVGFAEYDTTPHIYRFREHVAEMVEIFRDAGKQQVIQTFNWMLEDADLIVAEKPHGYNTEGDVYAFVGNWLGSNSEALKSITDSMKDKVIDKEEAKEILEQIKRNQFLEASFIKQLESIIEE